jgi:hypothetical protein
MMNNRKIELLMLRLVFVCCCCCCCRHHWCCCCCGRYRDSTDNFLPSPRLGCLQYNQSQLSDAQQACFISCNSVLTCSYGAWTHCVTVLFTSSRQVEFNIC